MFWRFLRWLFRREDFVQTVVALVLVIVAAVFESFG